MAVQVSDIADDLIATLPNLGRLKLTDVMTNYRNTHVVKRILNSSKTETLSGGNKFYFNLITDTNGSFRAVGMGHQTKANMANVLARGEMPWRRCVFNWAMEESLIQMNSGENQIINELQAQRLAGLGSFVLGMERSMWTLPTLAQFNDTHWATIPYFVVKNTTEASTDTTSDGFNGGAPSGYTTVAGLTPSTDVSGRYRNYTDVHTDDMAVLNDKMRRAAAKTNFEPFVEGIPSNEDGMDREIYTNYDTCAAITKFAEGRNDNLGFDVGETTTTFQRNKIQDIDALSTDTTNPVYMLDWSCMGTKKLKNWWMKEMAFPGSKNPNQPTMMFTEVVSVFNLYCTNRRKQSVIAKATTMTAPK